MKKSLSFELKKETRTYLLKVYTEDTQKELFSKESFPLCSLFIKDEKNDVSNQQPMNKQEVAFRKNTNIEEVIATLALNYDADLPALNKINKELVDLVSKDLKLDVPETQSKGVLPLF